MAKRTRNFDTRITMNGNTYEIFHYLDMKTHLMESHYHNFYEVFIFIDGDVDYWIEGSLYHLKPGDILFINPIELHRPVPVNENGKYERIVLWLNKQYLSEIENGLLEKCFDKTTPYYRKIIRLSPNERNTIKSLAEKLVLEYYNTEYCSSISSYGILLQLMASINRISVSHGSTPTEKNFTSTIITDILSYINKNFSDNLTLNSLASIFFINKYYLSHEFKRTVGTSVHRYILLKRLSIAHDLLSEGNPPGQVYMKCGFNEYSNFYKAFKSEYGIRPAECYKK